LNIFENNLIFFFKGKAKISGTTLRMQKVPSTNRHFYGPLLIIVFFIQKLEVWQHKQLHFKQRSKSI